MFRSFYLFLGSFVFRLFESLLVVLSVLRFSPSPSYALRLSNRRELPGKRYKRLRRLGHFFPGHRSAYC